MALHALLGCSEFILSHAVLQRGHRLETIYVYVFIGSCIVSVIQLNLHLVQLLRFNIDESFHLLTAPVA